MLETNTCISTECTIWDWRYASTPIEMWIDVNIQKPGRINCSYFPDPDPPRSVTFGLAVSGPVHTDPDLACYSEYYVTNWKLQVFHTYFLSFGHQQHSLAFMGTFYQQYGVSKKCSCKPSLGDGVGSGSEKNLTDPEHWTYKVGKHTKK